MAAALLAEKPVTNDADCNRERPLLRIGLAQDGAVQRYRQPDSEIDLPYGGKLYRYPSRFFLVHAAEHGIEHRTEIKLNLASVGVPTPDLDGWEYSEFAGYGAEV